MKTVYRVLSNGFCLSFTFLFLLACGDSSTENKSGALTAEEVKEVIAANPICDRTEIVKNKIMKVAKKANCEDLSVEDLAKIETMAFHNEDITELKAGDFAGLTGLKELLLSSVNLQALPEGLLKNLVNLESFYADGNSLQAVPEDFFDGLTSLEKIYLYNNQLSSLPEGLFDDLSSLEKVYLAKNQFSDEEKSRLEEELGEKLTSI